MNDIWDEKPVVKYNRGEDMWKNPIRVPDHECYVQEMDAWLEKVRADYDYYVNLAAEFAELYANAQEKAEKWDQFFEKPEARVRAVEILLEKGKKLEAIKTHRENFRHSSYIEWLRELDKILEGETLQNIGDTPT